MGKKPIQFIFGDRELFLTVNDLLEVPVEVIVNSVNSELLYKGSVATKILAVAGESLQRQTTQLIREYGPIDSGMAVYTGAGQLAYKAIIHAVGPMVSDDDAQNKIEQAVSRSLKLCDMNEWTSVAFPAIGTGHCKVPVDICAQAFFRSITHFWDARHECAIEKIVLCLRERHYRVFVDAFNDEGGAISQMNSEKINKESECIVGQIELTDDDIADLEKGQEDDWFK